MSYVAPGLMRSPQPEFEDLLMLQAEGLRTLVNLRAEARESQLYARQAGLDYVYLPVLDWGVPTPEQIEEFLQLADEPARCPLLMHCHGGVGRTGIFAACYRIHTGHPVEEAIRLSEAESPRADLKMTKAQLSFIRSWRKPFR